MQRRGVGFLLIVLVLVALSLLIDFGVVKRIPIIGQAFKSEPRLGLDVRGGFRFVLRAELDGKEAQLTDEQALQVLQTIERRSQQTLGVAESGVSRRGASRFVVELPGFTDEAEARSVLQASARLEWYWARNVVTALQPTRPYESFEGIPWAVGRKVRQVSSGRIGKIAKIISSQEFDVVFDTSPSKRVLRSDLELLQKDNGEEVSLFKRRGAANEEALIPGTTEWNVMMQGWELIAPGDTLLRAETERLPDGRYNINLQFNAEGTRKMNQFAHRVMNRQEFIAAVLDKNVVSFAYLKDNVTFERGLATIEGRFTPSEAKRTVDLLNAGAVPVDLVEESVTRISPTQGEDALRQIAFAGVIAFVVISVFLLVYYLFPGLVALIALLAYTAFCYAVFVQLGVTFSLAGIAGFILSIGMAVDANILIFERLKEELRAGRSLMTAIDLGFKRAFPAIIDSNACTILTCIVLYNFGTGPVRGFASTLSIGVLISLFTAITVTRSLLLFLVGSGIGRSQNLYGMNRGWFGEKIELRANEQPLNITGKMKRYFLISGMIILPGAIFMVLGGLKPNVEFLDGVESVVVLPKGSTTVPASLNAKLAKAGLRGGNVKVTPPAAGSENWIAFVTLPKDPNPELKRLVDSQNTAEKFKGRAMILEALGADTTPVHKEGTGELTGLKGEVSFEATSPQIRRDTINGAIWGVIVASTLIVFYLALRFGLTIGGFVYGFRFGMSAILAMLHDVLVVLGLAAIMGYFANWEVSQLTITAILTVIGFSVHDTIVIFDRIRENLRRPMPKETFDNLVNRSVTQSLARSLNTSATVIVTLAILAFVGSATPDLKHFNAAMLVGIASGTYSSIFNAAPILVIWERMVAKRKGVKATIMHDEALRARQEEEREATMARVGETDEGGEAGFAPTRRRRR